MPFISNKGARVTPSKKVNEEAPSLKRDFKHLGIWFLIYLAAFLYWELLIYLQVNSTLSGFGIWIIIFLPALAMLPAAVTGWWKNRTVQNIVSCLLMAVFAFYYLAQLIYYRIFGSLFSMSMVGIGGAAVGQFGWAMGSTLVDSVGWILLFLLPVALLLAGLLTSKKQLSYRPVLHLIPAVGIALLWFIAVLLLPLGGNDSYSAYSAYHSLLVDTDTASSKIGALTNSVVETSTMLFGGDVLNDEIAGDDGRTELNAADTVVVSLGEATSQSGQSQSTGSTAQDGTAPS